MERKERKGKRGREKAFILMSVKFFSKPRLAGLTSSIDGGLEGFLRHSRVNGRFVCIISDS